MANNFCQDDTARCRSISDIKAVPIGAKKYDLMNAAWGPGAHGMIDISSWDEGLRVSQRRPYLPTAYFNAGGLFPYCYGSEDCAGKNPSAGLQRPVPVASLVYGRKVDPDDVFPPFSGVKFGSYNSASGWDHAPGQKLPWEALADQVKSCPVAGPKNSPYCSNPDDPATGRCTGYYYGVTTDENGKPCMCPPR